MKYFALIQILIIGSQINHGSGTPLIEKRVLNQVDVTQEPCDNFHKYTCANANDSIWSQAKTIYDRLLIDLLNLDLTELKTPERLVQLQKFYRSCTNEGLRSRQGIKPLTTLIGRLGTFPIWNQAYDVNYSSYKTEDTMMRFRKEGIDLNGLFTINVGRHPANAIDTIHLSAPNCVLCSKRFRGVLKKHLIQVLYEIKLTQDDIMASYDELERVVKTVNLIAKSTPEISSRWREIKLDILQGYVPSIDWQSFLGNLAGKDINSNHSIILWDSLDLKELNSLIQNTSQETLSNYMYLNMIEQLGSKLLSALSEIVIVSSSNCLDMTRQYLNMLVVEQLVVMDARSSNSLKIAESRHLINDIFQILKAELENLSYLDWVSNDQYLQEILRHKSFGLRLIPGYDDRQVDVRLMDLLFNGLNLSEINFFENILQIKRRSMDNDFTFRLDNEDLIYMSVLGDPNHVSALYDPNFNTIHINMGVLVSGYFVEPDASTEVNFGLIGNLLAHEMSHSIDPMGINYDEFGFSLQYKDFKRALGQEYEKKLECVREQYDGLIISGTSKHLNGTRVLMENFADILGYQLALRAMKMWSHLRLPGTKLNDSLFWTASASLWCDNKFHLPHDIADQSDWDNHSPSEFRVNIAAANSDQLAKTFSCQEGSSMNPYKRCCFW